MNSRREGQNGSSSSAREERKESGAAGFGQPEVRNHYAQLAAHYESKANPACSRAYAELARKVLADARRILEIGAGSSTLLPHFSSAFRVGCDLSLAMLTAQRPPISWSRVAADAQSMPFGDAAFDGICAVNVLEHVPNPARLAEEAWRVLGAGGRFLAVTPNGDVEWLLEALERLHLKLPEGPHRFLTFADLAGLAEPLFRVIDHRRFLALPAGPPAWVKFVDRALGGRRGRGLFQYVVLEKRA
jgi:SAM-dependent methyltransferase